LSYKKDVADLRESPALIVQKILNKYEAIVDVYEPYNLSLSNSQSLEEALSNNDVIIVTANHTVFEEKITKELLEQHKVKILVD